MVKPWYKQFWPWFLIILPLTVVVWTIITVIVFSQNSVSLVTEDYYKKGKGINIDISKQNVAKELGLSAQAYSQGNDVVIQFEKGELEHFPAITAMFAHRTLPDRDFKQLLTSDANGLYRFTLTEELQGPWFIELTPHDEKWLVQGRVTFPTTTSVPLTN
ncbi:FixH family protein [Vibrio sinaloensis]|uniref:FixH family protein n=1 Tax=Photobacterium sp. (strain ATCC 43367) TaxID=379097 RepID=UPI002064B652|nr:FixH family protein [Vibrio sinaloensis]UPQ86774.1 FixH family protein [Vibrio sinaloensis]